MHETGIGSGGGYALRDGIGLEPRNSGRFNSTCRHAFFFWLEIRKRNPEENLKVTPFFFTTVVQLYSSSSVVLPTSRYFPSGLQTAEQKTSL